MASGDSGGSATKVRAAVADFLDSARARAWTGADRAAAGEIAAAFLAACYDDLGTRPDLLDQEQLREAVLDHLPRRLDPGAALAREAPRVVRALLDHQNEVRPNPNAWSFPAALDDVEPRFAAALQELGGTATETSAPEPIRRPGSKLGRNDPCPCGSGKKFKKCCMR